jgi:hypothetical protein
VSASGRLLLFTFWKFMVDEWLLSIAKQNYLTSSCAWLLTAYSVEKLFFVDFWTFPRKRVSIKTMGYLG